MAEGGIGRTGSEPERYIRHSSMYSRYSQSHVESVSVEIFSIMTRLGYGEEIRRWRVKKHKKHDRLLYARYSNITVITAGSKAEGLTCFLESDWDVLNVLNSILCVEAGINLHTIPDDVDLFRMDTRVYPGHCRLFLEGQALRSPKAIINSLCDNGYGDVLLSSCLLLDEYSPRLYRPPTHLSVVHHERAGPSLPESIAGIHLDMVPSLRCHCPSILQRWAARPRHWPSAVIVKKVVSLGAYLTPVGCKNSEAKHMEWRICFNTGESELVNNLNDTQAKVYVILKMILKDIIKPHKKEITSYVLKNIILWQAENTPQTKFNASSLFHWLHDGLKELRTAVEKKQLRYFIIPERNLMSACGLEDALQHKWVADITNMMDAGPRLILRLPKIRKAIICHPEPLLWFSRTMMELEMLALEAMNRTMQRGDENGVPSDFVGTMILIRQIKLSTEVALRMLEDGSSLNDLNDIVFRILQ